GELDLDRGRRPLRVVAAGLLAPRRRRPHPPAADPGDHRHHLQLVGRPASRLTARDFGEGAPGAPSFLPGPEVRALPPPVPDARGRLGEWLGSAWRWDS